MTQMSTAVLLCALFALALSAPYPPKRLAGPIEEFPFHRILDPKDVLTQERSASQYVWLDTTLAGGALYITTIPVDGPNQFVFSFASPIADKLTLSLSDPTGKIVDLDSIRKDGTFPIGDTIKIPVATYMVENSLQGFYTLTILPNGLSVEEADRLSESTYPNAMLTVINNDYLEIQSHLATYLIDVGDTVGVVSTLVNLQPGASQEVIHVTRAQMEVITPDGRDIEVDMHNDPAIVGAKAAAEGAYGAVITATVPGDYLVQARLEGWMTGSTATETVPFIRTTEHVIGVSASALTIPGTGSMRPDDANHVWLDIDVSPITPTADMQKFASKSKKSSAPLNFRAYAEVWGVDPQTGSAKAACWVGGVVDVTSGVASLQLDLRWLQRAGVKGPLSLQNTYLTDMGTSFPVAKFDGEIPLKNSAKLNVKLSPELKNMPIVKEMREGVKPQLNRTRSRSQVDVTLFLLPGYCASENPWVPDHFHEAQYFVQQGNFGHDEYSQKVMEYVNTFGPESFSLIGHSQGGFVSLHINNFYFTPLENAEGGRLIQTVGTPWQGCSAAGDAASLGSIFGVGCGANSDLTRDGALNWLSGISVETRQNVHSYTTTYKQGTFFGDYCSLPMNLILQWPNDGTTELKYGTLPGGTYEGNTERQCHTSDMAYMPQTSDENRNKLMNSLAAR